MLLEIFIIKRILIAFMKIIITRHGETEENAAGILQGHLPGKLSKIGIEQAKKLAYRLKDESFDCIYSSDLARAADTAKEIAEYHENIPLLFDQRIRERYFGTMEGKSHINLDTITKKTYYAESIEELIKRTGDFLDQLKREYQYKNCLIVGHGGSVGALLANLRKRTFKQIFELGPIQNTSITIFDPVPEMTLFNCAKHLYD